MLRSLPLMLGLVACAASLALAAPVESLPGPIINSTSFALLANSHYSVNSGFGPELPAQVLANVLWAMDRSPRLGAFREFYVATPENLYHYEPAGSLQFHIAGDQRYNSGSAFEIGVAADLPEDAGLAVQAGLLAAAAFREEYGAAASPMAWAADHANSTWRTDNPVLMATVFGRAESRPFDTTGAARGDGTLPLPVTAGPDSFEIVLMGLRPDTLFAGWSLSLETVSQLLWAACGPTPHRTINGRVGLTIPSGLAGYPHTTRVCHVGDGNVGLYHNSRGDSLLVPAHRLQSLAGTDRRDDLRAAAAVPATAPDYFVVCVPDADDWRSRQEAGLVAFGLLAQARALGIAGWLSRPLEPVEARAVARALNLPPGLVPLLVFAAGEAMTAVEEPPPGAVEIVRAGPVLRRGESVRVDYLLRMSGTVRVQVFDMLGRPVRQLSEAHRTAGYHGFEWDGTGAYGARVKPGNYVIGVFGPGAVAQHKVSVL